MLKTNEVQRVEVRRIPGSNKPVRMKSDYERARRVYGRYATYTGQPIYETGTTTS